MKCKGVAIIKLHIQRLPLIIIALDVPSKAHNSTIPRLNRRLPTKSQVSFKKKGEARQANINLNLFMAGGDPTL